MDISIAKLILLLWGLFSYGSPDGWDVAWQVRASVYLPDVSGSISFALDPVPVYYRPLPWNLCGEYNGVILIDPNAQEKGCARTLEHELAHVWQARSYGLLLPLSYAFSPSLWEPERPWAEVPASPRVLEWALIRVWWPFAPYSVP